MNGRKAKVIRKFVKIDINEVKRIPRAGFVSKVVNVVTKVAGKKHTSRQERMTAHSEKRCGYRRAKKQLGDIGTRTLIKNVRLRDEMESKR